MNKIAIIIPSRLNAQRLPNKPLKFINNKEMILHVYEAAVNSKEGDVYVAATDAKIIEIVKKFGGQAIKTSDHHKTGTDRIFEVFETALDKKPDIIINLQGDMPNINPDSISKLISLMKKNQCDIGTLASDLKSSSEIQNSNIVKVAVKDHLTESNFLKAYDFFRSNENSEYKIYHHIGIYAFTRKALTKYVNLERSKLEIERKLEQMRALENNMTINVGYVKSSPLSVDTEEDLIEIRNLMEKNEKN